MPQQLKILIIGAGIAGTALAFWLAKLGHDVTVIERYPELRASGLQIDLRGHGIEVMKRMGLEQAFRDVAVHETGLEVVDGAGRQWAWFPANTSGKGPQSFTSEWELMRGDMCRIMHDRSKKWGAKYVFGKTVVTFDEGSTAQEPGSGVDVTFSDGSTDRFDLMVGADGASSRTRRMLLSPDKDVLQYMRQSIAYFTLPREQKPGEDRRGTGYFTTGGRGVLIRRHDPHLIQVYLLFNSHYLENVKRGDVPAEKAALAKVFRGAGWRVDEFLKGMLEGADDFYCAHAGVVKLDAWSSGTGHVVLLGDAGYSTAVNGTGTTAAMVGAYVLAGEIGPDGDKDDLGAALKRYDDKLRPYAKQLQPNISSQGSEWGWWERFKESRLAIGMLYALFAVASLVRLDRLAMRFFPTSRNGWDLPDYPLLVDGINEPRG